MDDERPSLSSYSRRVLAQYWLLKEKFLGSESGSGAAADMVNQEGWMTMTGIHTHTTYAAIRNTD